MNKILITGGAGFIGQHLTLKLLSLGYEINILDNFSKQIHANNDDLPLAIKDKITLFKGDIRDRELLMNALVGVEKIVHLAAETGTGQSMYDIENYFSVNVQGTALLLDLLQNDKIGNQIKNIVVASSRAIYGEGAYFCSKDGIVFPDQRLFEHLENGKFEPICPICASNVEVEPTNEHAPFKPMSYYGITKQVQEQMILMFAKNKGINGFGLRYQNVYGPGQSLSNPYTGILAVFSNLAKEGKPIDIYEDGKESRDFVYIDDVVNATVNALNFQGKYVGPMNVGSGQQTSVLEVAQLINSYFGKSSTISISGSFRIGDIRHNKADLTIAQKILNYEPIIFFKQGILNFLNWAHDQNVQKFKSYEESVLELQSKGLMGKSNN
jgi:dTDP-L-rhamnose 4-epimerase